MVHFGQPRSLVASRERLSAYNRVWGGSFTLGGDFLHSVQHPDLCVRGRILCEIGLAEQFAWIASTWSAVFFNAGSGTRGVECGSMRSACRYIVKLWRLLSEPAVHAEDLIFDQGRECQKFIGFCDEPPYIECAVFSLTLVVQPKHLGYDSAVVVPTHYSNSVRVLDLGGSDVSSEEA